jgi:hypothetical protein
MLTGIRIIFAVISVFFAAMSVKTALTIHKTTSGSGDDLLTRVIALVLYTCISLVTVALAWAL